MFFQNNSAYVELLNYNKPKTIFTVESSLLKIKNIPGVNSYDFLRSSTPVSILYL